MKYDQIAEAYVTLLIEGRIDDLKKQNPHLADVIDSYSNSDPTPQKKFVPWLVSQHKKGNVTPDEPDLTQTLSGFETYKTRHGIKDHSSKSYQEIKSAVQPFLGTAATKNELKKQQIHAGIDQIYNSPDNKIQAFHIKTKEAAQHVYGGGKELGGLHTGWCVAARSEGCAFGNYGDMYTVHFKGDTKSPYAVHPDSNIITTKDNNPDEYQIQIGLKKFPHLQSAVSEILKNHEISVQETIRKLTSTDVTHNDLVKGINNKNERVREVVAKHEKSSPDILNTALHDNKSHIQNAALNNKNMTSELLSNVISGKYNNLSIDQAINSKALRSEHITDILKTNSSDIPLESKLLLLHHDKSTPEHLNIAINNPDPKIRLSVANHKLVTPDHIDKLINDPDPYVRRVITNRNDIPDSYKNKIFTDSDADVRNNLLKRKQNILSNSEIQKVLTSDASPNIRDTAASILLARKHFPEMKTKHIYNINHVDELNHLNDSELENAKKTFDFRFNSNMDPINFIKSDKLNDYVDQTVKSIHHIDPQNQNNAVIYAMHNNISSEGLLHLAKISHKNSPAIAIQALQNKNLKPEHAEQIKGMLKL